MAHKALALSLRFFFFTAADTSSRAPANHASARVRKNKTPPTNICQRRFSNQGRFGITK